MAGRCGTPARKVSDYCQVFVRTGVSARSEFEIPEVIDYALNGGVSVVLAETLGSCGAAYSVPEGHRCVGLDINANHLKGATTGWVTGVTRPVHRGRSTQVWQIDMHNDAGEMTCVSRITMAVLAPR